MKKRANIADPVLIADGVYWVGFADKRSGLHCNPYLIVDGDEAVVIDGGSRPDFPTVMLKILQSGISPNQIAALIYQHYDPDLCGSIPNFENIIDRDDLKIISDKRNTFFIHHYYVSSPIVSLNQLQHSYTFKSGRRLEFFNTPYCHSMGSFVTFDTKTKVLFTSDLFGGSYPNWNLFLRLPPDAQTCALQCATCRIPDKECPLADCMQFHRAVMPSTRALHNSLRIIAEIPFRILAPQHGSIIDTHADMVAVFKALLSLSDVGIDGVRTACAPCDAQRILDNCAKGCGLK